MVDDYEGDELDALGAEAEELPDEVKEEIEAEAEATAAELDKEKIPASFNTLPDETKADFIRRWSEGLGGLWRRFDGITRDATTSYGVLALSDVDYETRSSSLGGTRFVENFLANLLAMRRFKTEHADRGGQDNFKRYVPVKRMRHKVGNAFAYVKAEEKLDNFAGKTYGIEYSEDPDSPYQQLKAALIEHMESLGGDGNKAANWLDRYYNLRIPMPVYKVEEGRFWVQDLDHAEDNAHVRKGYLMLPIWALQERIKTEINKSPRLLTIFQKISTGQPITIQEDQECRSTVWKVRSKMAAEYLADYSLVAAAYDDYLIALFEAKREGKKLDLYDFFTVMTASEQRQIIKIAHQLMRGGDDRDRRIKADKDNGEINSTEIRVLKEAIDVVRVTEERYQNKADDELFETYEIPPGEIQTLEQRIRNLQAACNMFSWIAVPPRVDEFATVWWEWWEYEGEEFLQKNPPHPNAVRKHYKVYYLTAYDAHGLRKIINHIHASATMVRHYDNGVLSSNEVVKASDEYFGSQNDGCKIHQEFWPNVFEEALLDGNGNVVNHPRIRNWWLGTLGEPVRDGGLPQEAFIQTWPLVDQVVGHDGAMLSLVPYREPANWWFLQHMERKIAIQNSHNVLLDAARRLHDGGVLEYDDVLEKWVPKCEVNAVEGRDYARWPTGPVSGEVIDPPAVIFHDITASVIDLPEIVEWDRYITRNMLNRLNYEFAKLLGRCPFNQDGKWFNPENVLRTRDMMWMIYWYQHYDPERKFSHGIYHWGLHHLQQLRKNGVRLDGLLKEVNKLSEGLPDARKLSDEIHPLPDRLEHLEYRYDAEVAIRRLRQWVFDIVWREVAMLFNGVQFKDTRFPAGSRDWNQDLVGLRIFDKGSMLGLLNSGMWVRGALFPYEFERYWEVYLGTMPNPAFMSNERTWQEYQKAGRTWEQYLRTQGTWNQYISHCNAKSDEEKRALAWGTYLFWEKMYEDYRIIDLLWVGWLNPLFDAAKGLAEAQDYKPFGVFEYTDHIRSMLMARKTIMGFISGGLIKRTQGLKRWLFGWIPFFGPRFFGKSAAEVDAEFKNRVVHFFGEEILLKLTGDQINLP